MCGNGHTASHFVNLVKGTFLEGENRPNVENETTHHFQNVKYLLKVSTHNVFVKEVFPC